MAKNKQTRPNRRLSIPRELYDCLSAISYWQKESITVNEFVIDLLMILAREYGDTMVQDTEKSKQIMESLLGRTNVMNDSANNNRFFQEINI